jgi:MoaA/NifB/PqqE/SkfB family radical SAM enzyme
MLALWHWHIEISSKCTLKCPRCPRQEVPDTLVNTELTLEFFKKNFTPQFILDNVEKITFCGDDGDPIYAHDLIDVIRYFKSIKPVEFVIITNGSYKKSDWWVELGSILDTNDSVHFSVDGYDEYSNNLYRINSNFDSIINGIKTLRTHSKCSIVWAAIAFKFNEDKLEYMRTMAKNLGIDKFQLTKSTKFNFNNALYPINDPLQPKDSLISTSGRFERMITDFTNKPKKVNHSNIINYFKHKNKDKILPLCYVGNKGVYISAQGFLFPCCWVANRYSHNSEWKEISSKFNLNNIDLVDALKDEFWISEFTSFKWNECSNKCANNSDANYYLDW